MANYKINKLKINISFRQSSGLLVSSFLLSWIFPSQISPLESHICMLNHGLYFQQHFYSKEKGTTVLFFCFCFCFLVLSVDLKGSKICHAKIYLFDIGLFWAKGNTDPEDSGKALYLPFTWLNLHWKGGLYQEVNYY